MSNAPEAVPLVHPAIRAGLCTACSAITYTNTPDIIGPAV